MDTHDGPGAAVPQVAGDAVLLGCQPVTRDLEMDRRLVRSWSHSEAKDSTLDYEVKAEAVWPGVRRCIQEYRAQHTDLIIEGVAILPHLLVRDFPDSSNIRTVFIGDDDRERVRNVVLTRNFAWDDTHSVPDVVREKDLDWILKFGARLKSQVVKHSVAWVDVEKNERDLTVVLRALGLGL